jgi:hypothetical protein
VALRLTGLHASWSITRQARIAFTSELAEHRIDNPDPGKAMAVNSAARGVRRSMAAAPHVSLGIGPP